MGEEPEEVEEEVEEVEEVEKLEEVESETRKNAEPQEPREEKTNDAKPHTAAAPAASPSPAGASSDVGSLATLLQGQEQMLAQICAERLQQQSQEESQTESQLLAGFAGFITRQILLVLFGCCWWGGWVLLFVFSCLVWSHRLGPSASQVGTDQLVEVLKQAFQSAFLPPSEVKKADSPVVETRELVLRSSSEAPTMLYPPAHEPAATPAVMPEQPTSPSTTVPGTPAVKETMVDETLEDAGGAKNASNLAQLGTVPPEPPTAPSRQLSKEDVKGMSECNWDCSDRYFCCAVFMLLLFLPR